MRTFSLIFLSFFLLFNARAQQTANPAVHKVVIQEVLQTSGYTYLHVQEDTTKTWIAVPKIEAIVGDTVYCLAGMEMREFKSKELNRTFRSVYFMEGISKNADGFAKKEMTMPEHGKKTAAGRKDIKYVPSEGCTSLAQLFENMEVYSGKTITIKGEVVKYSENIMGKNWAHIQDGSEFDGIYDLTVTLGGAVKVGDKVSLEGKITLNKDFGSGYFFRVIMLDAVVK